MCGPNLGWEEKRELWDPALPLLSHVNEASCLTSESLCFHTEDQGDMAGRKLILPTCILYTGNRVVLISFNPQVGIPVPILLMRILKHDPPTSWVF